ncbi:MAG: S8 family serine peptidase [Elusimicrobiota bacterium]
MRKLKHFFLILLLFALSVVSAYSADSTYAKGQIIFKYKENIAKRSTLSDIKKETMNKHKIKNMNQLFKNRKNKTSAKSLSSIQAPDLSTVYYAEIDSSLDPLDVAKELANDPAIEYAQPNYLRETFSTTPNDPYFKQQWGLANDGTFATGAIPNKDINALDAWDITTGSNTVIIAIIDTGVDYNHEDLSANMRLNTNDGPTENGIDDDGNGYIDDYRGYDFSGNTEVSNQSLVTPDNNPIHYSGGNGWHGTHCAGIAGAVSNNGKGVAGVCWNIKLMPLKIFPNAYDNISAEAIEYAADNGAKILSCSWGGPSPAPTILTAIQYAKSKDCVVVFAAGNDNTETPIYPAYYDETIAVAATDWKDEKASFSNYGTWVDISAPGDSIASTYPGDSYAEADGTSMACPMIAGAAGLLLANNPSLSNTNITSLLKESADNTDGINPGYTDKLGSGRLNAYKALTFLSIEEVFDGLEEYDIDRTTSPTSLSAHWTSALTATTYYYAIGSVSGGSDIVGWTNNTLNTSVTHGGLDLIQGLTYYFSVFAENLTGDKSAVTSSNGVTVDLDRTIVYPNPFIPSESNYEHITFTNMYPGEDNLTINIYALSGELVRILTEGSEITDDHSVRTAVWDCKNESGKPCASGIYIYTIIGKNYKKTGKLGIIK